MDLKKPAFYHIPTVVAERVDAHEAFVFSVIYWFVNMKEGRCFASNERIAEALPYKSSAASVGNALLSLEKASVIRRIFSDEAKRNRIEIRPLIAYSVPPTDWTSHPQVEHVPPTGGQSINIQKENTSADRPREVFVDSEESERATKKPPKYPNARTVFAWFPHPEPSWQIDTTQCKHAELLFLRGEAKVRSALAYVEKHKDDEFFYSITSPCDLERKWTKLVNHKPV